MHRLHSQPIEIHQCSFLVHLNEAEVVLKFPCKLFVIWKTSGNKTIAKTNNNVKMENCKGVFDQTMEFKTYMSYDCEKNLYNTKDTAISLLLVSMRKPDEQKVVGRVSVDLAEVLNKQAFQEGQRHKLAFCSVKDATLNFSVRCEKVQKTDLKPFQLDMEEFSHISGPSKTMNLSSNSNQLNFKGQKKEPSEHNYSQTPSYRMRNQQSVPNLRNKQFSQITSPRKAEIDAQAKLKILQLEMDKKKLQTQISRLNEIAGQKKSLQEQALKLYELLDEKKTALNQQISQKQELLKENQKLKQNYLELEREKKITEDELLDNIKSETQLKIAAQKKYQEIKDKLDQNPQNQEKLSAEVGTEVLDLKEKVAKLQKDLQENQRQRIEYEQQNLQLKYELSDLKGEMDLYEQSILEKNEQIQRLIKEFERVKRQLADQKLKEVQLIKKIEQQPKLARSISQIEREQYNKEIESLKSMIKLLTEELVFTEHAKNKLKEMDQEYKKVCQEKQVLQREVERLMNQKSIIHSRISHRSVQKEGENEQNQKLTQKIEQLKFELQSVKQNLTTTEADYAQLLQLKKDLEIRLIQQQQGEQDKFNTANKQKLSQLELVNTLKTQNSSLIKQKKQLEVENGALKKQLKERDEITPKNDNLSRQIQKLGQQKISIENQLSQKNLMIQHFQASIDQKNEFLQQMERDIKNFHEEKNNIEISLKKIEYENKKLQSQLKNSNLNKQEESLQLKKLMSRNIQLEGELKTMQMKVQKIERELRVKEGSLMQKDIINENLNKNLQQEVNKIMEMEEKISKFSEKQAKMRENILVLEEESRKIYDIVIEKEENEDIQNQIIEEKQEQINNLRNELAYTKNKLVMYDQEANNLKKQVYDLRRDSIIKNTENDISDDNQGNNEEFDRYNQFIELNNQRIDELEEQLRKKDDELLQISINYEEKLERLEKEKRNLQNGRISVLQNQRAELKREKNQLYDQMKRFQLSNDQKNNKIKQLEKEKEEAKSQINRIASGNKQQNQFLRTRIQSLENQILDFEGQLTEQKNLVAQYLQQIQQMELRKYDQKLSLSKSENQGVFTTENSKMVENSKINELQKQNDILKKTNQTLQESLNKLKLQLNFTHKSLKNIQTQLDDKEVQKMNLQLDKQFRIADEKKKSAFGDSMRKSFSIDNQTQTHQIIEACKVLKEIMSKRAIKDSAQSVIELLVNKNVLMEEGMEKISLERGIIQENARKLSMEFQKIKAKVLKGKGSYQEKNQLLSSLKPCETQVKDLVCLSENLLDLQLDVDIDQ